jgi:hypothetical protein
MIDFLGIGPPKSGTTYLQSILIQHPEIYLSEKKEIQFFSNYYDEGIEWYNKHFEKKKPSQIAGEISPTYSHTTETLKRIKDYSDKYAPDMKIIFTYRDPIKRLVSAYQHNLRRVNYNMPVDEAIEIELSGKNTNKYMRLIRNSRYYETITEIKTLFPDHELLLISAEKELFNKEELMNTIRKVEKFLGVSEFSGYNFNVEDNSSYVPRFYGVQKILFHDNKLKRFLKAAIPFFKLRRKIRFAVRDLNKKVGGHEAYEKNYAISDEKKQLIYDKYLKEDYEKFNAEILNK